MDVRSAKMIETRHGLESNLVLLPYHCLAEPRLLTGSGIYNASCSREMFDYVIRSKRVGVRAAVKRLRTVFHKILQVFSYS